MIKDTYSKVARVYRGICYVCDKPILAGQAYTMSPIRISRPMRAIHQGECEFQEAHHGRIREEK